MPSLRLNRNQAPAELENVPDDLERDMKAWVRAWPSVEEAIAEFKQKVQAFRAINTDLNHKAGRRGSDRSLSREQREALLNLVARTAATQQAIDRIL